VQAARSALANAETTLQEAQSAETARAEIHTEWVRVGSELQLAKQRHQVALGRIQDRLDHAKKDAARLEGLDCAARGDDWVNEACRFVSDAVAAQRSIPILEAELTAATPVPQEVTDLSARREDLFATEASAGDTVEGVRQAREAVAEARRGIDDAERDLRAVEATANLVDRLESAKATLTQVEADQAAARDAHQRLSETGETRRKDLSYQMAQIEERGKTQRDQLNAAKDRLDPTLPDKVATEGRLLLQAKAAHERVAADVSRLRDAEGRLLGRIEAMEARAATFAEARELVERLDAEAANWQLMVKACSNDGIVALEIDDAGPSISHIANELLRDYDGGRYSVRIETQREKVSGGKSEDFDILVFDALGDRPYSLFRKSGGQVTYIDDAIVRAFRIYMTQRAGSQFQAVFSDERDGALDPERRSEFLGLKRRAMAQGGYEAEFFVSHTREIQEAADAAIVVGNVSADLLSSLTGAIVRVEAAA
jgi:exonuclease SbcC